MSADLEIANLSEKLNNSICVPNINDYQKFRNQFSFLDNKNYSEKKFDSINNLKLEFKKIDNNKNKHFEKNKKVIDFGLNQKGTFFGNKNFEKEKITNNLKTDKKKEEKSFKINLNHMNMKENYLIISSEFINENDNEVNNLSCN